MSPVTSETINVFVSNLYVFVWLRASGADSDIIHIRALKLKEIINTIDIKKHQVEIGEALAAYILNYAVKYFGRNNCQGCVSFIPCYSTEVTPPGPCDKYRRDDLVHESRLRVLTEAVLLLNGAFGINSPQLLSVVHRFLGEMALSRGQEKFTN